MEIMEFVMYLVWVVCLPFIGWSIIDLINVPAYLRMCRESLQECRQRKFEAGIQAGIREIINNPEYLQIIKKNG